MRSPSLVLLLCAGCGFQQVVSSSDFAGLDLSTTAGADLSASQSLDLAGVDLAGVDLSMRLGADMQLPPCPLPQLLIAVENTMNSASGGGRVLRLSLGGAMATPPTCSALSAQSFITPEPQSVAAVGDKVAVVGLDVLQLLDPSTDTVVWSMPIGSDDFPVDVFALSDPTGQQLVAAAYGTTHESPPLAIARVDAWGLDGTLVKSWMTNSSDLPLGLGIYGMTTHPKMPQHFVALDPDNSAWGWDVDPWAGSKSAFLGEATGAPISIYGDIEGTQMRFVWVDSTSPSAVFYFNEAEGTTLFGPIACMGCTLLHAVADPTDNLAFFGLCDAPSIDGRRVVRFDSAGGTCDTILDGAGFGPQSRLSRLAIAQ